MTCRWKKRQKECARSAWSRLAALVRILLDLCGEKRFRQWSRISRATISHDRSFSDHMVFGTKSGGRGLQQQDSLGAIVLCATNYALKGWRNSTC